MVANKHFERGMATMRPQLLWQRLKDFKDVFAVMGAVKLTISGLGTVVVMVLALLDGIPLSMVVLAALFAFTCLIWLIQGLLPWRLPQPSPGAFLDQNVNPTIERPIATPEDLARRLVRGKRFNIYDVPRTGSALTVVGQTFEECTIVGPAVITLTGAGTLQNNDFRAGSVDSLLLTVPKGHTLTGVIEFRDCKFKNCMLENIAVCGPVELTSRIRDSIA